MDRIKALREQIAELQDEAQALYELAKEEDRELTAEEQSRFDSITDETDGEIAAAYQELEALQKREQRMARIAAQRQAQNANPFSNPQSSPQPQRADIKVIRAPLRAFKNDHEGRQAAYDCGQWLKAIRGLSGGHRDEQAETYAANRFGDRVLATHTEGTNSAGGFTVPDPLSAAFIEYREMVGVARRICDVRPMTSDTLAIPKLSSGNTVTYPGEATGITPNDQTWAQVSLTAVKRAVLTKVSNELAADSVINIVDQLVSRLAHEFAKQEDNELINGDGTAAYGSEEGLLDQLGAAGLYTAPTGDNTWPELSLEDFTNTMAKMPSKYGAAMSWICSRPFYYGVMLKVLASAGGNAIANLEGGGNMATFLGYNVYMTDRMPTATAASTTSALFGAFSDGVVLGDREPLRIAFSDQRYFDEDVLAVRATSRYDIKVHEGGDGSDAGAYVGLATAAT